jgi:DNA invertase Pin-like site-specific DNA recombinase
MQTELNFYEEEQILEESLEYNRELGKTIRNIEYQKTRDNPETANQRNLIHKIILGHPEGITDMEIAVLTGISRSSVNARRNELPGVTAVGYAKYTDEFGMDHLNTLWGYNNNNI